MIALNSITDNQINDKLQQESVISIGSIILKNWEFQYELSDRIKLVPFYSIFTQNGNFRTMSELNSSLKKACNLLEKLYASVNKSFFNEQQCQFVITKMVQNGGLRINQNKLSSAGSLKNIEISAYKLERQMLKCVLSFYDYLEIASKMKCMSLNEICKTFVYFEDISSNNQKSKHKSIEADKKFLHQLSHGDEKPSAIIIKDSIVEQYYKTKQLYDSITSQYAIKSAK